MCTLVKKDNVGAVHLAKNPATTPNSKHIDIRHHFIRERVANGEFKVVYVPSEEQHVDFLTKLLHQGAFEVHRSFVMISKMFLRQTQSWPQRLAHWWVSSRPSRHDAVSADVES